MARTTSTEKKSYLGKVIGQNIKSARTRLGITQGELAERVELDNLTVSRIETGTQMPSIERLNDIAAALGLSLALLVTDADKHDVFDDLLAAALKDLPLREKEFVYAFAVQYAQHWRAGTKT